MPTTKQEIQGLNWVNLISKLKSLFTKVEAGTITQGEAITELNGSVVVADISSKVDEVIAALKTAGVIAE